MWTRSEPVGEGGTWRLRVISSNRDLPLCEGQEAAEEEREEEEEEEREEEGERERERGEVAEVKIERVFHHREIRDYCLPDRDSVMLRYSMKVTRDCPVTVQLSTSKKDAYIKLEVSTSIMPLYTVDLNTTSIYSGTPSGSIRTPLHN